MREPEVAHLELDLAVGAEPISGRMRSGDGTERRFTGMLELMVLLDDARGTPDDATSRRESGT